MLSDQDIRSILSEWPATQSLDAYMVAVQKRVAMAAMDQEVEPLCGPRYVHESKRRYKRGGSHPGAIRIRSEWVPMQVPRVRDTRTGKEEPLQAYQRLRELSETQQLRWVDIVFRGLSQRNYKHGTQECAERFGWSASTVSRIFTPHTAKILREFEQRDLSEPR